MFYWWESAAHMVEGYKYRGNDKILSWRIGAPWHYTLWGLAGITGPMGVAGINGG